MVSLSCAFSASAAEPRASEQALEQGLHAFQRGAFEDAVASLSQAVRLYERDGKPAGQVTALTALAQAYSALGQYRQAAARLDTAAQLAQRSGDPRRTAAVLAGLGNVQIALGLLPMADKNLNTGLELARRLGEQTLAAAILNDLGNLSAMQNNFGDALTAYRESALLAERRGQWLLRARALINAGTASRQSGLFDESEQLLDAASDQLPKLRPSYDKSRLAINLALAYRDLGPSRLGSAERFIRRASSLLNDAATAADGFGDRRTASYAWGYLGALYEDEGRHAEALQLTRRAIFEAQQINAPESLYRWQWQAGRLLKKTGAVDDAIDSYRRAMRTLQSIRPELSVAYGGTPVPFRDAVGAVYFELVDLLLQRTGSLPPPDQGAYLREARETIELLKAAELRDYFRDDCVDTLLAKSTSLDVVSQTAVVVYPILLADRTELLLSSPGGLKRLTVPVGLAAVTSEVREFRRKLEKRTTREYLPHAQQLYQWLVRPLEPDLARLRVETLVFVPDGPLRTVPIAALHDGKQFLVQKYALAITPGLNLTDPRPVNRQGLKMLAVGVTESVQGFPPLPNVSAELEALRNLFGSTTLLDQNFVVSRFEQELKKEPFTIVHVASHGQFGGNVRDTFLLAFDDKLTMDRLDQLVGVFKFRDDPLDLLTLSACDTAAGDDRAALGLAGVAVKAGARSAVATLWDVNDRVSADLIAHFYGELKEPAISRANALRRAQMKVLADPRYEHPGFWAPFLLINNWL